MLRVSFTPCSVIPFHIWTSSINIHHIKYKNYNEWERSRTRLTILTLIRNNCKKFDRVSNIYSVNFNGNRILVTRRTTYYQSHIFFHDLKTDQTLQSTTGNYKVMLGGYEDNTICMRCFSVHLNDKCYSSIINAFY